jgi:hypothetical protein
MHKRTHARTHAHTRARTLPPGFMPMTAVDSAGGGLGPLPPANSPPAESFIFLAVTLTGCPATNSSGCCVSVCVCVLSDDNGGSSKWLQDGLKRCKGSVKDERLSL